MLCKSRNNTWKYYKGTFLCQTEKVQWCTYLGIYTEHKMHQLFKTEEQRIIAGRVIWVQELFCNT